jgi:hypothetical protein
MRNKQGTEIRKRGSGFRVAPFFISKDPDKDGLKGGRSSLTVSHKRLVCTSK